tara:strand:+ start:462 stop:2090 length:1629 start_codon:yes stop_codon:yes gene_type:complete
MFQNLFVEKIDSTDYFFTINETEDSVNFIFSKSNSDNALSTGELSEKSGLLEINKKNIINLINVLKNKDDIDFNNYEISIPNHKKLNQREQHLTYIDQGSLLAPLFMGEVDLSMLRDYQKDGVDWLLGKEDGILADDMGLGKTLQTIKAMDILFRNGSVKKVLIVCPLSLIATWEFEISKWAKHLSISRVTSEGPGTTINWLKSLTSSHIIICNYEQLRQEIEPLEYTEFDIVITDEAHKIRKLSSQLSKGIEKINRKRFWALTGTPIENNIDDLISLLKHINSKKFQHLTKNRNPVLLQESAKPNVLRRLKKQVLKDLPEVIERNIPVQLSPLQEKEYLYVEKNKSKIISETGSYFSVLSKLRTICEGNGFKENAKVDKALELIEKISENGEKVIVFSYFLEPLALLEEKLTKNNDSIKFRKIIGEDSREIRDANIKEFKSDPNVTVLLASSKVASEGLTLTEANHVIFINKWWNPSSNHQARDRVVRIGQNKVVQVYSLFCVKTIEERVVKILENKEEVYKKVVDGMVDENFITSLLEEE